MPPASLPQAIFYNQNAANVLLCGLYAVAGDRKTEDMSDEKIYTLLILVFSAR